MEITRQGSFYVFSSRWEGNRQLQSRAEILGADGAMVQKDSSARNRKTEPNSS
jgi:hypothetical protein